MKTCTKCGETKPLDEYHKQKSARDGRQARCKACVKAYAADWYARNRDEVLAYQASYYQANRDAIRVYKAEYHSRPEVKAHRTRYMAEYHSRPEVKARTAEYRQTKPHIYWEHHYRERAMSYGYTPRVSSFTREELIKTHGPTCVHCGGPFESLDHFPQPISRGGAHSLENCRPSCMNCQQYSWREDFTA